MEKYGLEPFAYECSCEPDYSVCGSKFFLFWRDGCIIMLQILLGGGERHPILQRDVRTSRVSVHPRLPLPQVSPQVAGTVGALPARERLPFLMAPGQTTS